jgi:hypothetical protein
MPPRSQNARGSERRRSKSAGCRLGNAAPAAASHHGHLNSRLATPEPPEPTADALKPQPFLDGWSPHGPDGPLQTVLTASGDYRSREWTRSIQLWELAFSLVVNLGRKLPAGPS